MREILFRGKRLKDGEWVEGWVTSRFKKFFDGELLTRIQSNVFGGGLHLVDTETVGQYTGLTDKNGKNIFEGDIVKIAESQIGFVVYECGAFGIGVKPYIDWDYLDSEIAEITGCNNSPYFCRCDNFISLWELKWNYNQEENNCYVIEVIGNIHDNPELLRAHQKKEVRRMCEYQRINPNDEKSLPMCIVDNNYCTFCVLGNSNTYNKAKQKEKDNEKDRSI